MRRTLRAAASIAATLVVFGAAANGLAAQQQKGKEDVRAAIEAANRRTFIAGAEKKDPALIASVYTEDAIAYPANSEPVKGRAALQALWKSALDSGITGFELETAEVESAGDIAYETGTYAMKAQDKIVDRGKYLVVWKRVDSEWKLHRDMWTTSLPPSK